tara:strand:- start:329 stop:523 length:195 start_codon:yes stop_codon:yes gene_type:complete
MVSIAANIGKRVTKDTIDDAIESLNEDAGPVSESIIVVKMEAPQRMIGTKIASDPLNLFNVEAK